MKAIDFKDGFAELEAITAWFEQTDIDLSEGVTKFERGMELIAGLRSQLEQTQNQVEKIKEKFDTPSSRVAEVEEMPEPTETGDPELF